MSDALVPPMGPQVNIASNSVEIAMTARVITGADGNPASIILTGDHGSEIKFPGFAFPFVKNGHPVLAILSIVQVAAAEPLVAPKAGGIIRVGN